MVRLNKQQTLLIYLNWRNYQRRVVWTSVSVRKTQKLWLCFLADHRCSTVFGRSSPVDWIKQSCNFTACNPTVWIPLKWQRFGSCGAFDRRPSRVVESKLLWIWNRIAKYLCFRHIMSDLPFSSIWNTWTVRTCLLTPTIYVRTPVQMSRSVFLASLLSKWAFQFF